MKFGSGRLARELAQSLHKFFLQIIGDVVLGTEEDYTALRDYKYAVN
jgi:hypothetical protein